MICLHFVKEIARCLVFVLSYILFKKFQKSCKPTLRYAITCVVYASDNLHKWLSSEAILRSLRQGWQFLIYCLHVTYFDLPGCSSCSFCSTDQWVFCTIFYFCQPPHSSPQCLFCCPISLCRTFAVHSCKTNTETAGLPTYVEACKHAFAYMHIYLHNMYACMWCVPDMIN